jgi:superfamily II DNA or RNA helicase
LEQFPRGRFDYIVVDEFHHASATTYRRLINYFKPKFLLGLTATPERSDGADLLELCGGNLVFRCDLAEGIRRGLLCEFDYFGVPDEVDYTNIPWRSRRFDEAQLTTAVATLSRARNALEQLDRRGGSRTLAFCVSQRHADFMAGFLNDNGKRAVAVHTGATSAPRTQSLEQLQAGELDVVCAVDMFNEGVDLPDLDTVMMLRPTESKVLWLQQFGRGLRKAASGKRLRVIDYIGNHRTFLLKPQTLFGLTAGDQNIQNLLERYQAGTADIPPGCTVTYELAAIDILKGLLRVGRSPSEALRTYVQDFIDLHGVRPTAL